MIGVKRSRSASEILLLPKEPPLKLAKTQEENVVVEPIKQETETCEKLKEKVHVYNYCFSFLIRFCTKIIELEKKIESERISFEKKEECLNCEIDILNEIIEFKKCDDNIEPEDSNSLKSLNLISKELYKLNNQMLNFLRENKARRTKVMKIEK